MKKISIVLVLAALVLASLLLVSCSEKQIVIKNEYTVTFESNGGTEYEELVSKGNKINLPVPTKEGFIFEGWYLHTDFSGDKLEGVWLPTANMTLYAKWTPIAVYTVKFNTNGADEIDDISTYSEITLPTPERANYFFGGWYTDKKLEGEALSGKYTPTADITLYAKWLERNPNPIVYFKSNGGTKFADLETHGSPVMLPTTPQREYYTFDGWYLEPDFSGSKLDNVCTFLDDTTIYAKWIKNEGVIEVIFSTEGQTTHKPAYSTDGKSVELPIPSNYGYKFLGWYNGDNKVESPYKPTADVTLTAKWEKVTYVYVYYGLTSDYIRYEYKEGSTFSVSSIDAKCTETIYSEGIKCPFLKWTYEDGKDFPESVKVADKTIILVAKYDTSRFPVLTRFDKRSDGSLVSTGKGIHRYLVADDVVGTLSVDLTFSKGASGGVGISFRQTLSGYDYPHEGAGNEYIAAVLVPSNGSIQMSHVKGGKWTAISTIQLASLSSTWQAKFNAGAAGELMTVTFTVKSYENKFEVYIDGVLEYTCTNASLISGYKGTGFGIRSTTNGTVFSNPQFSEETNVDLPFVAPIAYVSDDTKSI